MEASSKQRPDPFPHGSGMQRAAKRPAAAAPARHVAPVSPRNAQLLRRARPNHQQAARGARAEAAEGDEGSIQSAMVGHLHAAAGERVCTCLI